MNIFGLDPDAPDRKQEQYSRRPFYPQPIKSVSPSPKVVADGSQEEKGFGYYVLKVTSFIFLGGLIIAFGICIFYNLIGIIILGCIYFVFYGIYKGIRFCFSSFFRLLTQE